MSTRPLPVDAPFARAVLERILRMRVEETAKVTSKLDELARLKVEELVLSRIVGALEAHLTDVEIRRLEAAAAEQGIQP